jgi:hypothetical protein
VAIKAEILQNILADSDKAKPIEGMENAYTPEDYNKVMAKNRAMGLINDGETDRYVPHTPEGAIEFDAFGRLRKIARTAPKMIDLNRYTQNRYMVEKVGIPSEGEKAERPAGTYIIMVLGEPIVKAITAMNELPKTVRAYRFRHTKDDWEYVGSEFIEDTVAYKMTKTLKPSDALKLMQKVQNFENTNDNEVGDSLDDIAGK